MLNTPYPEIMLKFWHASSVREQGETQVTYLMVHSQAGASDYLRAFKNDVRRMNYSLAEHSNPT